MLLLQIVCTRNVYNGDKSCLENPTSSTHCDPPHNPLVIPTLSSPRVYARSRRRAGQRNDAPLLPLPGAGRLRALHGPHVQKHLRVTYLKRVLVSQHAGQLHTVPLARVVLYGKLLLLLLLLVFGVQVEVESGPRPNDRCGGCCQGVGVLAALAVGRRRYRRGPVVRRLGTAGNRGAAGTFSTSNLECKQFNCDRPRECTHHAQPTTGTMQSLAATSKLGRCPGLQHEECRLTIVH